MVKSNPHTYIDTQTHTEQIKPQDLIATILRYFLDSYYFWQKIPSLKHSSIKIRELDNILLLKNTIN